MAGEENVEVAILPIGAAVAEAPLHVFVIYDERLVTAELFSGEVVLREPKEVSYHLELFEFFLAHSLRGSDATEFLRDIAGEFMSERE